MARIPGAKSSSIPASGCSRTKRATRGAVTQASVSAVTIAPVTGDMRPPLARTQPTGIHIVAGTAIDRASLSSSSIQSSPVVIAIFSYGARIQSTRT